MKPWIKLLLTVTVLAGMSARAHAQINIQGGQTFSEAFDEIGTAQTATLPPGFKADNPSSAATVGTYSAAGTATTQRAGDGMSTSATNGIYNFGAGPATTATDRAVGFLASGTSTKSGNLYLGLTNTGANSINSFSIGYNVEKYRNGSNAAGFSIQMFYSMDGSTWTNAGPGFLTSFSGDADNNGFTPAPGATVNVSSVLNQTLAAGSTLYLAWNYTVTSGTTTTNAQALGLDDITIFAAVPEPSVYMLLGVGILVCGQRFLRRRRSA
jgi:hypothetical protein